MQLFLFLFLHWFHFVIGFDCSLTFCLSTRREKMVCPRLSFSENFTISLVVTMDEKKQTNLENEEKTNPFGSMNQINLDVDGFTDFLFPSQIVARIPWKHCNNFASLLGKSKHIPSMWECKSISGWKLRLPLMDFCWIRRDVFQFPFQTIFTHPWHVNRL